MTGQEVKDAALSLVIVLKPSWKKDSPKAL